MLDHLVDRAASAVPVTPLRAAGLAAWLKTQPAPVQRWVKALDFQAKPGSTCLLPDGGGKLQRVLFGLEDGADRWSSAALPAALPAGTYQLDAEASCDPTLFAFGWAAGGYRFRRYRSEAAGSLARLVWPQGADKALVKRLVGALSLARDLITTPASDMGPAELSAAVKAVAKEHKAKVKEIVGDDLLKQNYPTIHMVGRASSRAPRLIDLRWGSEGPKLTLVGKGVCFDTGGLDLKGGNYMRLMKKDMGGAALMLGLAQAIMDAKLKLRLRLLIPAVENSVSGNAMRPLDVVKTRKGLTVEIGDTDAEGRLILCDALAEAESDKPDLIIDAATLTGAARVALGTEMPALFATRDATAEAVLQHGKNEEDPLWRLPLNKSYRRMLDSKVADINNCSESGYAGAITAALYLQEFVNPGSDWLHIDTMGWNLASRPGRPEGGEAFGLRALYAFVADWAKPKSPAARIVAKVPATRPAPRKPQVSRLRRR
ncbi:MAG TPA: leucyl aminopeptidase family protein [Dongiaceae bacterium]|nr:leucyl aminopeptidase family protein [Dongiaceae bacterium]